MPASKTVLVTGATGFIGRATVSALESSGWEVIKATRSIEQSVAHGFVAFDLSEPAEILAMVKNARFDAIVHLGANIGWAGATEPEMFVPNVLSTGCLGYLATQWDAQLIFASAAIVHGARKEIIDIDSPIAPDTPYGYSKWLGEQLLTASHARHCILRIAGVFGYGGPTHLGLNHAIAHAMKGEVPTQIGSGRALRNYVYVKDVAQAIVYALENQLAGVHLLAGDDVMQVSTMLQEICDTFLPGQYPVINSGPEATDQVIASSCCLPRTRGFRQALIDIRDESSQ